LALILTISGGISANAQQIFGSIYGTITDATGGAVVNAKVTVTDVNKGTQSVVMSDESGNYAKRQLIPDTYTVTVEAPGFQKIISSPLDVRVDDAAKFDVSLKVGDAAKEVIEVTAAAPLLQTDRADVAQTFDTTQINELPNIGRNAQSMELLQPGTARLGWQHASDENPQGSVQMIADGQIFASMGYELDGTTNQDPILGIIVINPTFDSLAEIKQANQNFDAEFNYAVNMASYSTKSGSNAFHADAFEYLQLTTPGFVTFAANPFNNLPVATYRQNQFGGSIGGAVIKDKLFFFGDAQLNREAEGGSVVTSVPTAANRNGDFSDALAYGAKNMVTVKSSSGAVLGSYNPYQIYDPTTPGTQATGIGRTPITGNIIPKSMLSPQAVNLLSYFPSPNFTPQIANADFVNNFAENGNTAITGNQWDTREDYYVNEKNTIFGRYSYASFTESAPGAFGLTAGGPSFGHYAGSSQALNQSLAFGWTNTLSPTLVNEFRFGWEKYHIFDVPNGYGTQPATAAGIPGLNLDNTYTSGLPAFYINNPVGDQGQLGYSLGVNQCNCPLTETESQYQFVDNATKIHGNHTLKFGADIRYAQNLRVPSDSHRAGELTFNGQETGVVCPLGVGVAGCGVGSGATPGVGFASFLLGDVGSFNRYVSSSTNAQETQPRYFFYGQDTYHPTSKLTVNLGLRYELIPPESVNGAGNGATFNLSNGLLYVFGDNQISSHGIQTANYHDFAPRIGVAFQIDKKTVIRAGYGWSYDLGVFGSNFGHNVTQNPPVLSNQTLNPVNGNFQDVFTLAQGPSAPATPVISANGTFVLPSGDNPKFRPATVTLPVTYQYNASIQRQVTNKIAVTASYVGNANRHGFLGTSNSYNVNIGQYNPNGPIIYPYASLAGGAIGNDTLSYYCDCANEQYNSFQATFKINALAGWTMQGNYTYQRQWGVGWDPYNSNYYFVYNRAAGEGYSNTLPRQQWTFAQNYDIPVGKGRKYMSSMNRIGDAIIGGWNLSGVTTYYSGFPFSPTIGNGYTGQPGTGPNNRPMAGTAITYENTRNEWFSTTSAASTYLPAAGTFGNYPINTLFGPHYIQQDLSMAKTFKLTEKLGFTLRADSTNLFNHTNLGLPNTNIDQGNVGQITGLAAGTGNYMRRMQFSGTIRF
jgi:hypothetical protein